MILYISFLYREPWTETIHAGRPDTICESCTCVWFEPGDMYPTLSTKSPATSKWLSSEGASSGGTRSRCPPWKWWLPNGY